MVINFGRRGRPPAWLALALVGSACLAAPTRAAPEETRAAAFRSVCQADAIVERARQITVRGKALRYISRAGRLPILDERTGEPQAWIYFTAYIAERRRGEAPRPLTFLWNGGPGANSGLLHLGGLGPRRIVIPDNPPLGGPGPERPGVVDNPHTWLAESDLVFVDPVGTGFSRPTSASAEPQFLNTRGDAEAIAEFIRVYRDRFGAWDQPLIEGGESYGVTRAAWVAEALLRRKIPLRGVIFITWDIPLGALPAPERRALALPTFTAAAFYHKRLTPDLQANFDRTMDEVTRWSQGEYRAAIARRRDLAPEEREAIAQKLARYAGLRPEQIDRTTLSIGTSFHSETLLKDQRLAVGRYDSRFVTSSERPLPASGHRIYMNSPDPDLVERYLRHEIGYQTDLGYTGGEREAYSVREPNDRKDVGARWGPVSSEVEDAQQFEAAFALEPRIKVVDMCGYYDLGANCIGDQYLIDNADPAIARNTTLRRYRGGHAPYLTAEVRPQMQRDFAEFIRSIVSP